MTLFDNLSEIYHWLPVTTSEKLANKIHFGNFYISNVTNETIYDGKGAEAQNLFTIYYIIPISFTTIIFGPLADQLNKRLDNGSNILRASFYVRKIFIVSKQKRYF